MVVHVFTGLHKSHEAVKASEALCQKLQGQRDAIRAIQRIVRGNIARQYVQKLKKEVHAATLLQGFMRLKLKFSPISNLKQSKNSAVLKLQRSIRTMISRRIFSEAMQLLDERLKKV